MKVLHFYKTYYPESFGGIEQVMYQICTGANKHNVSSAVLTLSNSDNLETLQLDGHTIYRVKRHLDIASNDMSLSALSKIKELAKEYDVIHYHAPWPFADLIHFLAHIKNPTLLTYHSDIVRQKTLLKLYSPLMKSFLKSVDHIVSTSPNYLASSETLQKFKNKVSVIPIGLDKTGYDKLVNGNNERVVPFIGQRFFLFVGMLRYYKGLHVLIDSLEGLDYPLIVAGKGPLEMELKEQAKKRGLKNIHFFGQVTESEKVELYQHCYAFLFPSQYRSEAFGISLLEAAMFGKPMVSCEIGSGTTFINIANETGLVVPPENPQELRAAIKFLWDNDDQAKLMGQRANKRFNEVFTAEKMAQSYVDIYRKLAPNA